MVTILAPMCLVKSLMSKHRLPNSGYETVDRSYTGNTKVSGSTPYWTLKTRSNTLQ